MKNNQSRRGQALVMMVMSLTVILGMMSLAVDLGWGYVQRESAQSAADAAAAAVVKAALTNSASSQACGTSGVWCGTPAGTATNCPATAPVSASTSFDNGCMLAAANGFTTTGSTTVSIQANTTSPAPTAPGTTVTYWATVLITGSPTSFFPLPKGGSALTLNVRSTAGITSSGAGA